MHPHIMLSDMVADRRREVIVEAARSRRAAGQSRRIRPFAVARRVVGLSLVRFGRALAGAAIPTADFPVPAGRRG